MAASNGEAGTALGTALVDKARLRSIDLRSLDLLPLFSGPAREARRSSIASNGSRDSSGMVSEGEARRSIDLRSLDLLPLFSGPLREARRASIASNGSRDEIVSLVAQSSTVGWIVRPGGCIRSKGALVKASDVDAIATGVMIAVFPPTAELHRGDPALGADRADSNPINILSKAWPIDRVTD